MGKNLAISVIVPVYNVEKYLSRCVGSILEQTFTDFELILVDDGSPDKSGELCDKYAKKDSRIKVIHKENGGVSSARNAGLDIAQGKYITFIDSDDWVSEKYLQVLIESMINEKVEIVVGSYEIRGQKCKLEQLETELINLNASSEKQKLTSYTQNLYGPVAKLFLSSIIKQNKLRFKLDMHYGEDTLFVRSYLRFCGTIYTVGNIIYFYNRFLVASLSKRLDLGRRQSIIVVLEDFYNMLIEVGFSENFRRQAVALQTFESFNYYVADIIRGVSKQSAVKEIENSLVAFEKYLSLDLEWSRIEDNYIRLRQAVLRKDCNEIYNIYQQKFKRSVFRKLASKIKRCLLVPYLERKRDGLNKYKYLDK